MRELTLRQIDGSAKHLGLGLCEQQKQRPPPEQRDFDCEKGKTVKLLTVRKKMDKF